MLDSYNDILSKYQPLVQISTLFEMKPVYFVGSALVAVILGLFLVFDIFTDYIVNTTSLLIPTVYVIKNSTTTSHSGVIAYIQVLAMIALASPVLVIVSWFIPFFSVGRVGMLYYLAKDEFKLAKQISAHVLPYINKVEETVKESPKQAKE
jgi:hypothetical protein